MFRGYHQYASNVCMISLSVFTDAGTSVCGCGSDLSSGGIHVEAFLWDSTPDSSKSARKRELWNHRHLVLWHQQTDRRTWILLHRFGYLSVCHYNTRMLRGLLQSKEYADRVCHHRHRHSRWRTHLPRNPLWLARYSTQLFTALLSEFYFHLSILDQDNSVIVLNTPHIRWLTHNLCKQFFLMFVGKQYNLSLTRTGSHGKSVWGSIVLLLIDVHTEL